MTNKGKYWSNKEGFDPKSFEPSEQRLRGRIQNPWFNQSLLDYHRYRCTLCPVFCQTMGKVLSGTTNSPTENTIKLVKDALAKQSIPMYTSAAHANIVKKSEECMYMFINNIV